MKQVISGLSSKLYFPIDIILGHYVCASYPPQTILWQLSEHVYRPFFVSETRTT
jgi:hypothetical protein